MSTAVLDRPETTTTTTTEQPPMFHYFRKADIVESAIGGAMVIALCGEKIVVTKAAKPDSPVCPECREIFDQMKRG